MKRTTDSKDSMDKIVSSTKTTGGQRCKELRISKGMNQAKLAEALGVSASSISMCESSSGPSLDMLIRYVDYFNVSADYLLGRTTVKQARENVKAYEKTLGLNEQAIKVLIDSERKRKARYSEQKAESYLRTLPNNSYNAFSDSDIASYDEYNELLYECQEYEQARKSRSLFLNTLITDKIFQNICDSFAMGHSKLWWAYMAKHPEVYDKINKNTPLKIRGMNMEDIDTSMRGVITAEGEIAAKARLYDCLQYFLAFLNNRTSELDK